MNFSGIIPAVLTPFDDQLAVDATAFDAALNRLIAAGSSALVVNGTMGEAGSLSREERAANVRAALATSAGRVPVIVGVSAGATQDAVGYAADARAAGADAVMSLPPLLYRGDERELIAHFRAIAEAAGLPVMAYNNPEASGTDLSPEQLLRLVDAVDAITVVKESSGDARRVSALVAANPQLDVLAGGDDSALEGLAAGARGWISGVAVAVPEACVALQRHVDAGELAQARALYARLLPLARFDMTPKLVQYYKGALDEIGEPGGGACRAPRLPLTPAETAALREALDLVRAPQEA